jgi:hypothetical protein
MNKIIKKIVPLFPSFGRVRVGFIIACTVGSLFIGCKKDNNNSGSSIVGVWHPLKQAVLSGKNGNVIDEDAFDDCVKQSTFEFTSAGKINEKGYVKDGASCVIDTEITVDYSFNKDKMELTWDGTTLKVHSLTSNELSIIFSELPDQDGDGIDDLYVQVLAK